MHTKATEIKTKPSIKVSLIDGTVISILRKQKWHKCNGWRPKMVFHYALILKLIPNPYCSFKENG